MLAPRHKAMLEQQLAPIAGQTDNTNLNDSLFACASAMMNMIDLLDRLPHLSIEEIEELLVELQSGTEEETATNELFRICDC